MTGEPWRSIALVRCSARATSGITIHHGFCREARRPRRSASPATPADGGEYGQPWPTNWLTP